MAKSKNSIVAVTTAAISFLFVILAFSTSHWLDNDGKGEPMFSNLGLWQVCFNGYFHQNHWYDWVFTNCWWVFSEEYYIIHDILLPDFFVATQFFFTLTFTLMLIAIFLVILFLTCSREHDRYILLLFVIGSDLVLAAISGTIAVIIFGARGDGRDWMPHWEHNDVSWSYALAVVGSVFLYISGILFLVEGRIHMRKQNGDYRSSAQHSAQTKTSYI